MYNYDVIVCGGGTAGVMATIAAAKGGAKTLVIEQYGNLGGTAVSGIPFLGIYDGNDERVNGGLVEELVERMKKENGTLDGVFGATWNDGKYRFSITPFDEEIYKYVIQEMILEAGAEILFYSFISDVTTEGRNIKSVEVVNKSGKREYTAKVFIDTTGDADVAFRAGVAMVEKSSVQNASILFKVGNVNNHRFLEALETGKGIAGWGQWHTRVLKGKRLNSDEIGPVHMAGHIIAGEGREITFTAVSIYDGEVSLNATRTINIHGGSAESLTEGEISERRHIHEIMATLRDNVPGFENAHIIASAPIGIRESRNIDGRYRLEQEDVLSGRQFCDSVARGAYPIDRHDPKGGRTQFAFIEGCGSYSIPFRAMLPKEYDNLLVAGRCVSASHIAMGSARIMGAAMSQGQAAGTAAAIAISDNVPVCEVNIAKLQEKLTSDGALI
ncbi:MAG: FAD-dependent oxidoreductase [Clostridiales bacterium]|nr:FAD-dependent oxidoreductase [Clostridiales bacterium]